MRLITTLQVMRMFARMAGRVPAGHLLYLLRQISREKPHRFGGRTRINTFFPPCPSPAFDRFCDAVAGRRRVPYSTYIAVTGNCPFSCGHCSYAGREGSPLTGRQWLDVIGQVKRLGTCTLGLTGGEPLLRDDLEELVAAASPEMAGIIFTTGHGLTAGRARRLARAGVACVTIGLESADAAVHDRVRGAAGSFAAAERAARLCRDAGIYTAVSIMATRERIADGTLERVYELGERWAVGEFRVLSPVATGAMVGCAAVMLNETERRAVIEFHESHNRRRRGPAVAAFARLESPELFGCGAGYHHLFIDASGKVCPCDLTPLSFGDVTREPLAEIWRRMGAWFPRPRRACLMASLAEKTGGLAPPLPLCRERSEQCCRPPEPDEPLPEGYRRLLRPSDRQIGRRGDADHDVLEVQRDDRPPGRQED